MLRAGPRRTHHAEEAPSEWRDRLDYPSRPVPRAAARHSPTFHDTFWSIVSKCLDRSRKRVGGASVYVCVYSPE